MYCSTRADDTIVKHFYRMVERSPSARALIAPAVSESWTYLDLATRARACARELVRIGVGAGDCVLVPESREPWIVAGYLGIMHVGAAFVPIDLRWPRDRLALIASDTSAKAVIARRFQTVDGVGCSIIDPETFIRGDGDIPDDSSEAEGVASVMYTSGSTGRPKGVAVPHRAICRLVVDCEFMRLSPATVFLQYAPLAFDAATLEVWGPLLNGGQCVIHPRAGAPDLDEYQRIVEQFGVNCAWLTASLFNFFVDQRVDVLASLDYLLTGGEALSVAHVVRANAALPNTQLINGYGPTENTTFTTCYAIPKDFSATASSVPIGFPIQGTGVRIVDHEGRYVAEGEPGELWATGAGVALGYLNLPQETAIRFRNDESGRAYRTGDIARRRPDGSLEYLGRSDDQIKLDGHRIELGEIDHTGARVRGVESFRSSVVSEPNGVRRIIGYFVGSTDPVSLRRSLASSLPDFMVPFRCVAVAELPITENGKLDRARLPNPFVMTLVTEPGRGSADTESLVRSAWIDVLGGAEAFDNNTNFFDAGGTSMDMLRLHEHCRRRLSREISIVDLFEYPTIRSLARFVDGHDARDESISPRMRAKKRFDSVAKRKAKRRTDVSGT